MSRVSSHKYDVQKCSESVLTKRGYPKGNLMNLKVVENM